MCIDCLRTKDKPEKEALLFFCFLCSWTLCSIYFTYKHEYVHNTYTRIQTHIHALIHNKYIHTNSLFVFVHSHTYNHIHMHVLHTFTHFCQSFSSLRTIIILPPTAKSRKWCKQQYCYGVVTNSSYPATLSPPERLDCSARTCLNFDMQIPFLKKTSSWPTICWFQGSITTRRLPNDCEISRDSRRMGSCQGTARRLAT